MANLLDLLDQQIVTKDGRATAYFEELFYQVIRSLGGENAPGLDEISERTVFSTVSPLPIDDVYTHSVSSNYTCLSGTDEIIDVTDTCTITLSNNPKEKETKKISHQGGYGDIVTITDGVGTDYLHVPGDSVIYSYSIELDRWL